MRFGTPNPYPPEQAAVRGCVPLARFPSEIGGCSPHGLG